MPDFFLLFLQTILPISFDLSIEIHIYISGLFFWEGYIFGPYKTFFSSRAEAMIEYLKVTQDLETYGITYYEVKNKKGTKVHTTFKLETHD